jgi:hypothetical protein
MRKEGVRFLLASVGFTLSLGTPGVLATSTAAVIFTKPAVLHPVVADDDEGGSDDPDGGEGEGGDDSD